MALQKSPRKVERKKRVILPGGKFASGKKVGRPRKLQTEKITLHLQPELLEELKLLATLHYRGNMSAFLRVVLTNALPGLQVISEQANRMADEKRPHADLVKKKRGRPPKVEKPDEDLGFEVV